MLLNTLKFIASLFFFLMCLKLFSKMCQQAIPIDIESKLLGQKHSKMKVAIAGMLLTAFLQSSSVVVVVIIGLVESKALSAKNGLAAVLGTEVGTTMTGQLISFPVANYYPIIIIIIILVTIVPRLRKLTPLVLCFCFASIISKINGFTV